MWSWLVVALAGQGVVVPLEERGSSTGVTGTGMTWDEVLAIDGVGGHLGGRQQDSLIPVWIGAVQVPVGWAQLGRRWVVSADLDQDGALAPGEYVELRGKQVRGKKLAELRTTMSRARPDELGGGTVDVEVVVRVGTAEVDGTRVFSVRHPGSRVGRHPDGWSVGVQSTGNLYEGPALELVVGEVGEEPAWSNRLARYPGDAGVVWADDRAWHVTVQADGQALYIEPADEVPGGLRVGGPAPDFTVLASDGAEHAVSDYRGSWLLLDFWATWCGPCIALHPEVEALVQAYDLAVLGISADEDQATLDRWLARNPTSWPSAAVGPQGQANQLYGVSEWPSHALVDPEGRLVILGYFPAVKRALEDGVTSQ